MTEQTSTAANGYSPIGVDYPKKIEAIFPNDPDVAADTIRAADKSLRDKQARLPLSERPPVFKPFSVSEVLKRPDKEWLATGSIGKSDIVVMFGDAASGKTSTSTDLIFNAALGLPFANLFPIPRPLKVAYCAGEGYGGIKSRFAAWLNHHSATTPEKFNLIEQNLTTYFQVPQLFLREVPETIFEFVKEWKAAGRCQLDLLVVDTYRSAIVGGSESLQVDTGVILEAIKHAMAELGCTFYLIHHENRRGEYSGSTALKGMADTMIQARIVDKASNVRVLECHKMKDGEEFKPLFFRLAKEPTSGSVYVEWLEETVVKLESDAPKKDQAKKDIMALLEEKPGLSQTQIVRNLTEMSRKTILTALKELEESGMVDVGEGPNNSRIYQLRMVIP